MAQGKKKKPVLNTKAIIARLNKQAPEYYQPSTKIPSGKNVVPTPLGQPALTVPKLLSATQADITKLEKAMVHAKNGSVKRAFQSLPRHLRRRTASHNVKRVPKRMRARAIREMKEKKDEEGKGFNGKHAPKLRLLLKKKEKGVSRSRRLYLMRRLRKLLRYATHLKKTGDLAIMPPGLFKRSKMRNQMKQLTLEITEMKKKADSDGQRLNNPIGSHDNYSKFALAKFKPHAIKYAKRQRDSVWLPTHVWHAKRAKMVKVWGYAISQTPTLKSYRNTHRKSIRDGCVVWDTSYLGTMILKFAPDKPQELSAVCEYLFRKIPRDGKVWFGNIHTGNKLNGPGEVLKMGCILVMKVHPSFYKVLYTMIRVLRKSSKFSFEMEDCRYALGSIDFVGPNSLSAASSILHLTDKTSPVSQLFRKVCSAQDVALVPVGTCMALEAEDPRRYFHPNSENKTNLLQTENVLNAIEALSENRGIDPKILTKLFTSKGRLQSYQNQPSLKNLGSRRSKAMTEQSIPKVSTDPTVPVMIYRTEIGFRLILPWFWVLPFWHRLVKTPHVFVGGLEQYHQVRTERGLMFFPNDYPFTPKGLQKSKLDILDGEAAYIKRPPNKRVKFSKLKIYPNSPITGEHGSPFGADWVYLKFLRLVVRDLQNYTVESDQLVGYLKERLREFIDHKSSDEIRPFNLSSFFDTEDKFKTWLRHNWRAIYTITNVQAPPSKLEMLESAKVDESEDMKWEQLKILEKEMIEPSPNPLLRVVEALIASGELAVQEDATSDEDIQDWLNAAAEKDFDGYPNKDAVDIDEEHERIIANVKSALEDTDSRIQLYTRRPKRPTQMPIKLETDKNQRQMKSDFRLSVKMIKFDCTKGGTPRCNARVYIGASTPGPENLVGFVTSANYNLSLGRVTGIACVAADATDDTRTPLCLRNAGETTFTSVSWELIHV